MKLSDYLIKFVKIRIKFINKNNVNIQIYKYSLQVTSYEILKKIII